MTKFLTTAALAVTAATALFAAPAMAANSDSKPFTARAVILKPLTLTNVTDLDFGTITMGAALASSSVSVNQAGTRTCGTNLSCSGTPTAADFTVAGVALQTLDVDVVAPATLDDAFGNSVAFSASGPATVTLIADGTGTFSVGGSITVASTTADGAYSADVDVTVSYQ